MDDDFDPTYTNPTDIDATGSAPIDFESAHTDPTDDDPTHTNPTDPDPTDFEATDEPFSIADARASGLTDGELRNPRWRRAFSGVRSTHEPETPEELARHYAPKMRKEAYFSHVTAALLHGMWLPAMLESRMEVHVAVPPPVRAPRDRRVKGHQLIERPGLVQERDGLRLASPRETWCQLATILSLADLVAAGDSLLAKNRRGRLPLHSLVAAVEAGDRPRQTLLERALPELREGVRSPKETQLRRLLLASGLPEPEVNGEIFDADGERVGESDLVYRAQRVVVEFEGWYHFERVQARKDVRKYDLLRALGWTVIRVVEEDFAHPESIVARVRMALEHA